jgi:hypothetical protein
MTIANCNAYAQIDFFARLTCSLAVRLRGASASEKNVQGAIAMTSRERVARAVNHQVPDRVPIDLGAMKASGIAAIAYDKVKRELGIATPTKVIDPRFMIAAVEDEVLRLLHGDIVPLDVSCVLPMVRPERVGSEGPSGRVPPAAGGCT